VATAYCDPRYTNEKRLISTLIHDYSGVRKENIAWCMAGIRAEGVYAETIQISARPEGDEVAKEPTVSMQGDVGASPGNDFSSSAYLSPPISHGEGSPNVMDSADISQYTSCWPTSATAEVSTQTSHPSQDQIQLNFTDPMNKSLVKIMQAYQDREYEKLLIRDRVLRTRQDLDEQKTIELQNCISTLKSAIEEIETKGASLVKELTNDLTPDERQAMERGIDTPKARKRKELESVVTEHTELLQRISKQVHGIETVREEQDAFVSNAKAHIKDVVAVEDGIDAVLAFLNGLPTCKVPA
jgi:hypothetical protein